MNDWVFVTLTDKPVDMSMLHVLRDEGIDPRIVEVNSESKLPGKRAPYLYKGKTLVAHGRPDFLDIRRLLKCYAD
jgi:hypothetical protein